MLLLLKFKFKDFLFFVENIFLLLGTPLNVKEIFNLFFLDNIAFVELLVQSLLNVLQILILLEVDL